MFRISTIIDPICWPCKKNLKKFRAPGAPAACNPTPQAKQGPFSFVVTGSQSPVFRRSWPAMAACGDDLPKIGPEYGYRRSVRLTVHNQGSSNSDLPVFPLALSFGHSAPFQGAIIQGTDDDRLRAEATGAALAIHAPVSYPADTVEEIQRLADLRCTGSSQHAVDAQGTLRLDVPLAANGASILVIRDAEP